MGKISSAQQFLRDIKVQKKLLKQGLLADQVWLGGRPKKAVIHMVFMVLLCLLVPMRWASAESGNGRYFTVAHIKVVGLYRIKKATVLNYLALKQGARLYQRETGALIRRLYATHFFSDIRLARKGNTLVVKVVEHPIVASVRISGNKVITEQEIQAVFEKLDIQPGRVLSPFRLTQLKQSLLSEYRQRSLYHAQVQLHMTPALQHRVHVNLEIKEGGVAKVRSITFLGNQHFSRRQLLKQLQMTTPSIWTLVTKHDQYSEHKLTEDLERLRGFYLDRGFLSFQVISHHASITADKRWVDIRIQVEEGLPYTVNAVTVDAHDLPAAAQAHLSSLLALRPGVLFSRALIMDTQSAMARYLADGGYAFPNIQVKPVLDSARSQVRICFLVHTGPRMYVHRIHFLGNTKTADYVLRREMRQLEGARFSLSRVDESKRRLSNLGYLKQVAVETKPVSNTTNQVDLVYHVTETSSATANVQMGYSDIDGFLYGANVNQMNFMGTGKSVTVAFNHSAYSDRYSFSYHNPYHSLLGVSRGFHVYSEKVTPSGVNLSTYQNDVYGFSVHYGIPSGTYSNWQLSYGYEHMQLYVPADASHEVINYVAEHGKHFNQFKLGTGWFYNSYDRAIFPTHGLQQNFDLEWGLPIASHSINYYRLRYSLDVYHALFHNFVGRVHAVLGYGRGYGRTGSDLPFFKNFYAGGIGSVRGYRGNSLGPRDSKGYAMGGNVLALSSLELILPQVFGDTIRVSLFADVGAVDKDRWGDPAASVGIALRWRSPMAPLVFSVAKALHVRDNNAEGFQFSIGTGL